MFRSTPPHQTSYSPPSRLHELGVAELFVVSSVRLWTLPYADPGRVYPDWRQGFAHAKIDSAGTRGFDTLCRIVTTTTWRSLEVPSLCCPVLGSTETRILGVTGLLQRGHAAGAAQLLESGCPASAVRVAIEPARAFAFALQSRQLWLGARRPRHSPDCRRVALRQAHGPTRLH